MNVINRIANCHENPKIENSNENNVCNDKTDYVEDKILNIASKIAQEDDYKKEEVKISDAWKELKLKLTEKVITTLNFTIDTKWFTVVDICA